MRSKSEVEQDKGKFYKLYRNAINILINMKYTSPLSGNISAELTSLMQELYEISVEAEKQYSKDLIKD